MLLKVFLFCRVIHSVKISYLLIKVSDEGYKIIYGCVYTTKYVSNEDLVSLALKVICAFCRVLNLALGIRCWSKEIWMATILFISIMDKNFIYLRVS